MKTFESGRERILTKLRARTGRDNLRQRTLSAREQRRREEREQRRRTR